MYCKSCGQIIDETGVFCKYCGYSSGQLSRGTLLYNGRYEIVDIIKTGGMAKVYTCIDRNLCGIYLAIKEMTNIFSSHNEREKAIEKFTREAIFLARLRHNGLPVVHDYFVENNNYYITMDFVEGYNIKDILKKNNYNGFTCKEVIDCGIQLCNILKYLHSQSPPVIHRDIKPANIIKNESDGKITLVDFGIASLFEDQITGTMSATIGYAPPEQLTGKAIVESDIYSLGVTLYQMLTGCKVEDLREQQFSFHPLSSLRPDINASLCNVIGKAIEIKVKNRFSSAAEMRQALIEARDGEQWQRDSINKRENGYYLPADWQSGLEKKEDFVISCSEPEFPQEKQDKYPASPSFDEKEEHLKKLLGLEYKSYRGSEDIEVSPFSTHIPVDFQNHILKGTIGIDIDTSFIKLLQMARDRKTYIYPSLYMFEPVPKGSFKEDNFHNPGSVAKIIKKFISDKNLTFDNISFSLPAGESIIRTLILPVKDNKKLPSIIKEEISSSITFSKAKIEVSILCPSIPDNEGYMKVSVTAMNKDFIHKLETIGKSLGAKFNIVSAHRAMFKTLQLTGAEQNNTAIINISSLNTAITIIRDGIIEQTGSFKRGFQDFVKALAAGKEISLSKAREILGHIEIDITRADKKNMNLFHIIVPSIRDWVTDLMKLFSSLGTDYKLNKNNYSSLILCGEGATVKYFNTFVGNQIGIKCHNFKMPEGEFNNSFPEEYSPHFISCPGLCVDNFYKDDCETEKFEIKNSLLSSLFGH